MVALKQRVLLVLGTDSLRRRSIVEEVKNKLRNQRTAIDSYVIYPKDVNLENIYEKIFTFSFNKEKIIIIKDACNLPKEVCDFLLNNLSKIIENNFLIFEMDKDSQSIIFDKKINSNKLFSFLLKNAAITKMSAAAYQPSLEGFRQSLRKNDLSAALYILEKLFEGKSNGRELGPQIIGLLVNEFGYSANNAKKITHLNYLWELDRNIKERGYDPRFAIEVCLAKLFLT